jgi:FdrA protein
LESDPKTRHIVLISKPPSTLVAEKIVERLRDTQKSATVCFFGAQDLELPAKIVGTRTLRATAANALGSKESIFGQFDIARKVTSDRKWIRGLFSGGSLAAEAQVIFLDQGFEVMSNAPIFAKNMFREGVPGHTLLDLGDDQYTRGRPHPMIDPAVRDEPFRKALDDNEVGVILLDIVIGFGSCADPASQVVQVLDKHQHHDPIVVASVTGTEDDPQVLSRQVAILESAGVSVAPSNAHAVETALVSISS